MNILTLDCAGLGNIQVVTPSNEDIREDISRHPDNYPSSYLEDHDMVKCFCCKRAWPKDDSFQMSDGKWACERCWENAR